ncbi:hypothetical protein ACGFNP_20635 [Nonomuraea sp. NPDC049269]|uniref:hypothetical protein n=1 Tax=Nonomuraea sp. NPDC049269 TaxID=3364349 RepID=UPI0037158688
MTGDAVAIKRAVHDRLRSKLDMAKAWLTAAGSGGLDVGYRRPAERAPQPEPSDADGLAWALVHLHDAGECLGTLNGYLLDGPSAQIGNVSAAIPGLINDVWETLNACQDLAKSHLRADTAGDAKAKYHADVKGRLEANVKALEDLQTECETLRAEFVPLTLGDQDDVQPAVVPALSRMAQILDQARRCCLKCYLALQVVESKEMMSAAQGTSLTPYEWPVLPYIDHQEMLLAYLDVPSDDKKRDDADTLLAQALSAPETMRYVHEAIQEVNAGQLARQAPV